MKASVLSLSPLALAFIASTQGAMMYRDIVEKRQSSGSILACTGTYLSGTCTTLFVSIPACQSLPLLAPTWDDIITSAVPLSSKSLRCTAWENSDCSGSSVAFTFGGPQNIGTIVSGISGFTCSIIPPPF